jgi:hypothetical protein
MYRFKKEKLTHSNKMTSTNQYEMRHSLGVPEGVVGRSATQAERPTVVRNRYGEIVIDYTMSDGTDARDSPIFIVEGTGYRTRERRIN